MKALENLTSLSEFIVQEHGAPGTKERAPFEAGYETFKLGVLLQQARQAKGADPSTTSRIIRHR